MSRIWIMGWCAYCGDPFVTAYQKDARYCCETHKRRHARACRRARHMGVDCEPYYRRDIFVRDGWRCQLCGEPVPRHANNRDPSVTTIDHIIPLSRGGADAPQNVQTAHLVCNQERNEQAQREPAP